MNPWYYKVGDVLIKKRKPCLPGDRVHVTVRKGLYTVQTVQLTYFTVAARNKPSFKCRWDELICLEGQGTSVEKSVKQILRSLDISKQEIEMVLNNMKSK